MLSLSDATELLFGATLVHRTRGTVVKVSPPMVRVILNGVYGTKSIKVADLRESSPDTNDRRGIYTYKHGNGVECFIAGPMFMKCQVIATGEVEDLPLQELTPRMQREPVLDQQGNLIGHSIGPFEVDRDAS